MLTGVCVCVRLHGRSSLQISTDHINTQVKKKLVNAHVYALDVSPDALSVARANAQEIGADIHFVEGDVLNNGTWEKLPHFTYIVSNPPYVKRSEQAEMDERVKNYEPGTALFVPDDDALVFYRAIAELGRAKLKTGGKIFVEINVARGLETAIVFQKAGMSDVRIVPDLQGKERYIICTLSK